MLSRLMQSMAEDEELPSLHITHNFEGKLCRRAFEFCEKYINDPYPDITFPLDNQKMLPNYYNNFLDGLTLQSIILLLQLSDFLDIPELLKLICFKLAYLFRDIRYEQRLDLFNIKKPIMLESANI